MSKSKQYTEPSKQDSPKTIMLLLKHYLLCLLSAWQHNINGGNNFMENASNTR